MIRHQPTTELKSLVDCSERERESFRNLVVNAGEVEPTGLDGRIARAEALVFLRLDNATIGVGALKNPEGWYTRKVFKRANAKNDARLFGLELGWVVFEEAHRGNFFSRRIVQALVTRAGDRKIWATSVSTRAAMHKALMECGFERDGSEWQSLRRPDETLFLFINNST